MTNSVPAGFGAYAIAETPASTIRIDWSTGDFNKFFIDAKPATNTPYEVFIRYRGVERQSNTVNVSVSLPKALASFEIDPTSVRCLAKNNFRFKNTTVVSPGALTSYQWDFGDGNTLSGFAPTHQYSGVQTYTVKLTATDELGCSSSTSNTLAVLSSPLKPVVSIVSGAAKFCTGDSVLLSSVVPQPDALIKFNWYRETVLVGSSKSIGLKLAGTYLLEATNANGCRDSALIELSTLQRPSKPIIKVADGFSAAFCEGDSAVLQAVSAENLLGYTWAASLSSAYLNLSGIVQSGLTVQAPANMGTNSTTRNYRVASTDQNKCVSDWSEPLAVTVLPSPPVSIGADGVSTTICDGNSVLLKASATVELSRFAWSRDGVAVQDGLDAFWPAKATGSYQLKATNVFACQRMSNKIDVLVNALPPSPVIQPAANIPEIVSSQELKICSGGSGTLRVSFFVGAVYQWFKDGIAVTGASKDSLVVNTAGKYRVSTSLIGCSSLSQETTIGLLPLPTGVMVEPEFPAICLGAERVLTANGAAGYQWYYNYIPIQGAIDAAYKAVTPGVYQVEFSSNKGCKKMSPNFISLSLIRKPTPRFSVDIYCTGSVATFTNLSQTANSGSVAQIWSFQNGKTDSSFNAKHEFTSSGRYKVCLDVIPIACPQLRDSSVVNIQIEAAPPGVTYPALNSMVGKSISLVARSIGDFYEWKPNAGLNSPYIRIPILNAPSKEQRYTVDITTRSGCRTIDTQLVRIFDNQEIYVAGGFTPNNDGNNDRAYPILVGVAAFRYMKIFNRWGVQVFQTASTDPGQGWDGSFKGVAQPADTYTWVISALGDNEKEIRKSGSLVLIR